jgi:hypothetical protein
MHRMHRKVSKLNLWQRIAVVLGLGAIIGFGTAGIVSAATGDVPAVGLKGTGNVYECVNTTTHVKYANTKLSNASCPAGTKGLNFYGRAQAPSRVGDAQVADFAPLDSVPTGGGFNANSTPIGSVDGLGAGTYLLNFNAKAKADVATAGDVFPQFFIYNQPRNADFNGNLFNVGTGALEPFGTNHDSYFSGSAVVTVPAGTTLFVYAFGYDSDAGAGSYALEAASLSIVQLSS